MGTFFQPRPLVCARFIKQNVFRLYGKDSSVWHGVARINGEIEEYLVELSGVSHYRPEIFLFVNFEGDRLGKGFTNNSADLCNNIARLDENTFPFDSFRKSNNLFYNLRAPLRAHFYHCKNERVFRRIGVAAQHLSTHQDRREDVVQIVSNASGKL